MGKGSYLGGSTIISHPKGKAPRREKWIPTKRVPDESTVVAKVVRR